MKRIFLSFESEVGESSTWPKPDEVGFALGIVLAMHLMTVFVIVAGLRELGVS